MIVESVDIFIQRFLKDNQKYPNKKDIRNHFEWDLLSYNICIILLLNQRTCSRKDLILKNDIIKKSFISLKNSEKLELIDFTFENWELKDYLIPISIDSVNILFQEDRIKEAQEILNIINKESDYISNVKDFFNIKAEYRAKVSFNALNKNLQDYDLKFKSEDIQKIYYRYFKKHLDISLEDTQLKQILKTEEVNDKYEIRKEITYECTLNIMSGVVNIHILDQIEQNLMIDQGINALELRKEKKKIKQEFSSFLADIFLGPAYSVIAASYKVLQAWSYHSDFEKELFQYILINKDRNLDLKAAFEYVKRQEIREINHDWNRDFTSEYNNFYNRIKENNRIDEENDKAMYDLQKIIKKQIGLENSNASICLFVDYILENQNFLDKIFHKFQNLSYAKWSYLRKEVANSILEITEKNRLEEINNKKDLKSDLQILKELLVSLDSKINPKNLTKNQITNLITLANIYRNKPEDFKNNVEKLYL